MANHPTADESVQRSVMEHARKWREWSLELPYLRFPPEWEVAVVPPFGGALIRFLVREPGMKERVSVYLDVDCSLGFVEYEGGYWEIYPDKDGENARYYLEDVDGVFEGIAESLKEMK